LNQIEKLKTGRTLLNTILYGLICLKNQDIQTKKALTKHLFLIIHGIKIDETAALQRCRNARITKEYIIDLLNANGIRSDIFSNSYYLNWYISENYFDEDGNLSMMYNSILSYYKSKFDFRSYYRSEADLSPFDNGRFYWRFYSDDCIQNFYLNLFYEMKDSDDKSHVDRFVEGFPDDLNALTFLFCNCLTSKGYLSTKLQEVVSRFLIAIKHNNEGDVSPVPINIYKRYIYIELFEDDSVWERLLPHTKDNNRDVIHRDIIRV